MSSITTHNLRADRFFPGELVVSASQLSATLSALARNVLFLRAISSSMVVTTPPRFPTDDAGLGGGSSGIGGASAGVSAAAAAAQIDLRYDESPSAGVDTKSIEQSVAHIVAPGATAGAASRPASPHAGLAATDWQLRPALMTALAPRKRDAKDERRRRNNNNKTSPAEGGAKAEPAKRRVSPSSSPPSAAAAARVEESEEPALPCTARLFILKVAIESSASSAGGGGSWFGSFSSSFASPTREVVEEWCIPIVVLRDSDAAQLRRHIDRFRAQQRIAVDLDVKAAARSDDEDIADDGGSDGDAMGSAQRSNQLVHPSAHTLARVFSSGGSGLSGDDDDDDDAVLVSEADAREAPEPVRAAAASQGEPSSSSSTTVAAAASGGTKPKTAASTDAAAAAAASLSPDALEMLCAMLEPDSAARLQRIVLWMQTAVLDPVANHTVVSPPHALAAGKGGGGGKGEFPPPRPPPRRTGSAASPNSSLNASVGSSTSSAGNVSVFETAPRVTVSVTYTSFAPRDGRLVEKRAGVHNSSSSSGSTTNNASFTAGAVAAAASSPNRPATGAGSYFRGFSMPSLW